ncbi:hypothetical protein BHE74_00005744 [Ensete ventricosum]|nr:hypothetical protein BHE74_00005744 [Ensete ventricosum]
MTSGVASGPCNRCPQGRERAGRPLVDAAHPIRGGLRIRSPSGLSLPPPLRLVSCFGTAWLGFACRLPPEPSVPIRHLSNERAPTMGDRLRSGAHMQGFVMIQLASHDWSEALQIERQDKVRARASVVRWAKTLKGNEKPIGESGGFLGGFKQRNSKQLCTKKTIKADLSLERSQLHKRRKTFEASKDEYCPVKKDMQKIRDSSVGITEGESVAKVVVEPEKAPQHHHDPGSPLITEVKDLTEPLVNMIGQQVIEEPQKEASVEQFKTCVGVSVERSKTEIHLDNMSTFPLVEKYLLDNEDSHVKSQTVPTVACRSSGTNNQSICYWVSSLPLNANENFLAGEQEDHKIQKIGLNEHQTPGVMGANFVASEEVTCKFLLTEEGICHIVNEDQNNGLGAVTVIPVSLTATDIGTCINCNYSDTMSKDAFSHLVCENGHVPGNGMHACGKTMHACEANGKYQ